MLKTVCLLFGGVSPEHDVSLQTALSVLRNIDRERFRVLPVGITRKGLWYLYSGAIEALADGAWERSDRLTRCALSPVRGEGLLLMEEDGVRAEPVDCVFPALHGANGEDGSIQGLCQVAGLPCVGAPVGASAVSMDKTITKAVVDRLGIRQADYRTVYLRDHLRDPEAAIRAVEAAFCYPVFVKPARTGSSVGVAKAADRAALVGALDDAFRYDDHLLVEEFCPGQEIEVAVIGNLEPEVSCCGEIIPGDEFYTYDDKYINGVSQGLIPASLPEQTAEAIRAAARAIYMAVGCRGLSRVDFFVLRESGALCFNEINTLPGFTPISMYPKLFAHGGLSYPDLVSRLIDCAFEEHARVCQLGW